MKIITLFVITLFLGACASSDPRQDGFFGGLHGIVSGNYDNRVAQREQAYANAQSRQKSAQSQNQVLQNQYAQKQLELNNLKTEAANLDNQTRQLYANLQNLRAKDTSTQQRKQQLMQKVAATNGELVKVRNYAASRGAEQNIDALSRRKAQLEAEVRDMWALFHQLQ